MSRFDYVKYNDASAAAQAEFKKEFTKLEELVEINLIGGKAKALVLTKLEEAYMWVGKAIRDSQLNEGQTDLEETRSNS